MAIYRETDTDRHRETDRKRERDGETEKDRDRETGILRNWLMQLEALTCPKCTGRAPGWKLRQDLMLQS